jgi:uncharacterized iron-regulated protein
MRLPVLRFLVIPALLIMASCTAPRQITDAPEADEAVKTAYALFTAEGERTGYAQLLAEAKRADIILFGELHNDPVAHWLQLELAHDLHEQGSRPLSIAMEMLEADNQDAVTAWANGGLTWDEFREQVRLWGNFETDYLRVAYLARSEDLPLIASNIPRRFASLVYREGLEALDDLSEEEKSWMMPLPVEVDLSLPGYANILEMARGHGGDNLGYAQAVKDATMAWFLVQHAGEHPDRRILHLNGTYHSDNYEGIYWYLRHFGFEGRVMTVSNWLASDPARFDEEFQNRADIILLVNERMTRTH